MSQVGLSNNHPIVSFDVGAVLPHQINLSSSGEFIIIKETLFAITGS